MALQYKKASPQQLRDLFNQHYAPRLANNDLVLVEVYSSPAKAKFEPPGTKSVTFEIYDPHLLDSGTARKVAKVHAYIRPDGSIGASGKYDPKTVRIGSIVYVFANSP